MLVREEGQDPLADDDLTYLSFLCGAWVVLERLRAVGRDPGSMRPSLFLPDVPLLGDLPEAVELDVLAGTWARHRSDDVHLASLLDAAVVFAGSGLAGDLVVTGRAWVRAALRQGARQLDVRLDAWTARHVGLQLTRWWPGLDLGNCWDLSDLEDFLPDQIQPLVEARGRRTASPALAANLRGLLREEVIRTFLPLLGG
jgi:hypothetical protein